MAHLMNILRFMTVPGIYIMSSLPSVSPQLASFSLTIPQCFLFCFTGPSNITFDHGSSYRVANINVTDSSHPACFENTRHTYWVTREITPFQGYAPKDQELLRF